MLFLKVTIQSKRKGLSVVILVLLKKWRSNFLFCNLFESHSSMKVNGLSIVILHLLSQPKVELCISEELCDSLNSINVKRTYLSFWPCYHTRIPTMWDAPFFLKVWISWRRWHFTSIKELAEVVVRRIWGASRTSVQNFLEVVQFRL